MRIWQILNFIIIMIISIIIVLCKKWGKKSQCHIIKIEIKKYSKKKKKENSMKIILIALIIKNLF